MRRALVACLAALSLVPTAVAQAPREAWAGPAAARPANIVFVLTDDLSTDLVRWMPAVRRLRRDGVSFDRYFVSDSLCCPSRTSIFTGQYPHNSGVVTNRGTSGGYSKFASAGLESTTWATSLREEGYRTGLLGKFLNGYDATQDPPPIGFDEWDGTDEGYRQLDYTLNENGVPYYYGYRPRDFLNVVLRRKALDFIDTAAATGQPFALEVSTTTPHSPYRFAPRDSGRLRGARAPRPSSFNRPNLDAPSWLAGRPRLGRGQRAQLDHVYRKRARAVLAVDRMVAAIRARLLATGQAQNTYFVFSSDNGLHIGEHRLAPGKQTAFDSDVRVPLIVAGPGVPAGQRTAVIAQNTDLRPTFEAIAGRSGEPDVDGMSLLPWLVQPGLGGGRDAALIEHVRESFAPGDPDAQRRQEGNPPDYQALRLPYETYVRYANGEREYYDLLRDPDQRFNRVSELSPARLEWLDARLDALHACRGSAGCTTPAEPLPGPAAVEAASPAFSGG